MKNRTPATEQEQALQLAYSLLEVLWASGASDVVTVTAVRILYCLDTTKRTLPVSEKANHQQDALPQTSS
jgi:hypothetical protein